MKKSAIMLEQAKETIMERGESYGDPNENFERIADLWIALLGDDTLKRPLSSQDVAAMMICLKLARLASTKGHVDSMLDICGYAALMSELD